MREDLQVIRCSYIHSGSVGFGKDNSNVWFLASCFEVFFGDFDVVSI